MPHWDNDEPQGRDPNPKDCENCDLVIDEPLRGDCKAYRITKPSYVYFEGGKCPKKIVGNKRSFR